MNMDTKYITDKDVKTAVDELVRDTGCTKIHACNVMLGLAAASGASALVDQLLAIRNPLLGIE